MARRTGKDGALSLNVGGGGATFLAALRSWELNDESTEVESTAAGDDYVSREALRGDWTLDFEALLEIASPYVLPSTLRGASVAFSAEVLDTDANGLISGTGLGKNLRISSPYDGMVLIRGQVICNGTGLTYDLSPAT